ncbi:adenylosuccinate synthetase [Patescibacteria group bacterium]|nr:adenylosuccinate synthetase [Patescibacteria group bacterium]MBU2036456.1 adenylosuccinate synthetase [Patescibacteria group bacterium]
MYIERKPEVRKNAWVVMGAQYGDEGKGKISTFISLREGSNMVIRAGAGPNAEHGVFLDDNSEYLKANQLPLGGIFLKHIQIRVGREVVVDPEKLLAEIEKYNLADRVKVDRWCGIVEQKHIRAEQRSKHLKEGQGSTLTGTGEARVDYVRRKNKYAKNIQILQDMNLLTNVEEEVNNDENMSTIELSQGALLSRTHSLQENDSCTSVAINVAAAMSQVLLNPHRLKGSTLLVKTMPTREGEGTFGKSRELTQQEIIDRGIVEYSSIGNKIRRKAVEPDWDLLQEAARINGPTEIALTFCDHWDPDMKNVVDRNKITESTKKLIRHVEAVTNAPVTILETGKPFGCIIDLSDKNIDFNSYIHGEVIINT